MKEIQIGNRTITVQREWITGFLATWILGLLAHAYRFFNFLPTWDSMFNFKGTGATFYSGRCFLGFFSGLSSEYDMPWVNGALSLFYISIVVVLLIDMFQVKSRLSCILVAGLIVSFPTTTSTFAYMFTADGYMAAFLLSVLGVYLTYKIKHGIWAGIVCIGLSMGTYQAYISVTLVVIMMIVIMDMMFEGKSFKQMFLDDWKYLILVLGGAIFYKVVDSIINAYYGITLTSYQGIGSMGILTLGQYKQALHKTLSCLADLWYLKTGIQEANHYAYANLIVILFVAATTVFLVIKNRVYKDIPGVIVTFLAAGLLPVVAFAVNFVSADVTYHTLMEMAVCFVYILLLLYIERGKWEKKAGKLWKTAGLLALVYLVYYNTINANLAYNSMNLSYQKSYAVCGNILDRIQDLDEYPQTAKVAMMGTYHAYSGGVEDLHPDIMGVSQDIYLEGDYHYIAMWNYCFGLGFALTSGEEKDAIRATEEYQNMAVYPAKGSVRVINNTIVVKFE